MSGPSASARFKHVGNPNRRVRYIALDIECPGANVLKNPIIAVGMAWVDRNDADDSIVCAGSRLWTFPFKRPDPQSDEWSTFEPRCWNEFWINQQHTLSMIERHTAGQQFASEKDIWNDIRATLDGLTMQTKANQGKAVLVSDNPAYDIGRINTELSRYDIQTFDYLSKETGAPRSYSSVRFTGTIQRLNKLGKLHIKYDVPDIPFQHDHMPQNDAMVIAWKYACADVQIGIE